MIRVTEREREREREVMKMDCILNGRDSLISLKEKHEKVCIKMQ